MNRLLTNTLALLMLSSCTSGCHHKTVATELPRKAFMFVSHDALFEICGDENCEPIASGTMIGSGFMVSTNGVDSWGVTAGHLCEVDVKGTALDQPSVKLKSMFKITTFNGGTYKAEVENIYSDLDLCVMKIPGMQATKLVDIASEPPHHGEKVYTTSAPLGVFDNDMLLTFDGYYSGKTTNIPTPDGKPAIYDIYTVPAKGGSSGSPIYNSKGEVVGVTSAALVSFPHLLLSPSQESVQAVLESVAEKKYEPPSKK